MDGMDRDPGVFRIGPEPFRELRRVFAARLEHDLDRGQPSLGRDERSFLGRGMGKEGAAGHAEADAPDMIDTLVLAGKVASHRLDPEETVGHGVAGISVVVMP